MPEDLNGERTPVLLTTSFMVYVNGHPDTENEEAFQELSDLVDRIQGSVVEVFRGEPSVEILGVIGIHYPEDKESSVHRCSECGIWLTNEKLPNPRDGLMSGYLVDGKYLCDQHQEIAIETGRIPRIESY